ncbi:unnamed protein product [Triticum turgidum subsp. durum]|uniref:Uncharacterized protein n=1 Tax=Triticum turgidum subsp. durum TaxID=4567 RepID=A0A9R1ADI8_TRITD|nr:unnamed protein product [Triticum turgidum subsp. durum]
MDAVGFHPAQAPHPSAELASALAPCAADLSFVPVPAVASSSSSSAPPDAEAAGRPPRRRRTSRWRPRDVRDGRVLLDWISLDSEADSEESILLEDDDSEEDSEELGDGEDGPCLAWTKRERRNTARFHLAVCHPLSRRYVLLPTIPEDLAAQPRDRLLAFDPVLAPATGDDGEEEPFKVICFARYQTKLLLFVFSSTASDSEQWSMVDSPFAPVLEHTSCFDCVRGCFYWSQPWELDDDLRVLDTRTLRFSTVNILTGYHLQLRDADPTIEFFTDSRRNAVVVGREGVIEMFSLIRQNGSFALHHTSLQDNSHEWNLEKIVQLPEQYHECTISTVGAAEGLLFLQGAPLGSGFKNLDCYSMDIKTYEITKVCTKMESFFKRKRVLPYFSFPRLLSEPAI